MVLSVQQHPKSVAVSFVRVGVMIELRRIIVGVDEGESLELVLADGANHVRGDGRQDGLFFCELGVEVQRVFFIFLYQKTTSLEPLTIHIYTIVYGDIS